MYDGIRLDLFQLPLKWNMKKYNFCFRILDGGILERHTNTPLANEYRLNS